MATNPYDEPRSLDEAMESLTLTPLKPRSALKPLVFTNVPAGETIIRIDVYREDNRREYWWQFWRPKYGTEHWLAMTEKGVYVITEALEAQTKGKK